MSKEQIEEMKSDICARTDYCYGACGVCDIGSIAEQLYNAGYRKQSEWISVDERLPDVLDDYLVTIKLKYAWEPEWEYDVDVASLVVEGGYIDGIWDTLHDWIEGQECHVTHWMPLPEPTKMKCGAE